MAVQNVNFRPPEFPQNERFLALNCVFSQENWQIRKKFWQAKL